MLRKPIVDVDEVVVGNHRCHHVRVLLTGFFRIAGEVALKPHTWESITGSGYASRHDPAGEWLYGMEVCVDPDYRGYRIGQRLYKERKKLCQSLGLQGIVFAGRLLEIISDQESQTVAVAESIAHELGHLAARLRLEPQVRTPG